MQCGCLWWDWSCLCQQVMSVCVAWWLFPLIDNPLYTKISKPSKLFEWTFYFQGDSPSDPTAGSWRDSWFITKSKTFNRHLRWLFFLGSELVITSSPSFNHKLDVTHSRKAAQRNNHWRSSYPESFPLPLRMKNIWTTSTMTAPKHRQHFVHFPIPCFIFHHHYIHVIVHRLSCWWCTQNFNQETTNLNTAGLPSVLALVYSVSSTFFALELRETSSESTIFEGNITNLRRPSSSSIIPS